MKKFLAALLLAVSIPAHAYLSPTTGTSPLTTKGDVYSYSSGPGRVPIGTNGTCAVADSTQTFGWAWESCSGSNATEDLDQVLTAGATSTQTATLGQLIDSGLTANTAVTANGSKQLASSSTTATELGYVHGVTSAIQTQLAALQSALTFSAPLVNTAGTVTCTAATNSVAGCLSAADHTSFAGKQAAGSYVVTTNNGSDFASPSATLTTLGGIPAAGGEFTGPISVQNATTPTGAAIFDGNGVDDLRSPIVIRNGTNAVTQWDFYIVPSSGIFSIYNPDENTVGLTLNPLGASGVGPGAISRLWSVNGVDTSTDATSDPSAGSVPSVSIKNTNSTVGNHEAVTFANQGDAVIAQIQGVNENHSSAGSQSGHVEIHTRLAGVDATNAIFNSDGTVTLPVQGSGVTPACSSGMGGKTAYTSGWILCVCNGSAWKQVINQAVACTF